MFAITTVIAQTRIAQVAALLVLLTAIVLAALGLVGADDASAAVRCTSRRGC